MQTVLLLLFFISLASFSSCSTCRCGWTNPTRIVGGSKRKINEYPLAGIFDINANYIDCGAIIINHKQVITTASCVYDKDINNTAVIVNKYDKMTGKKSKRTINVLSIIKHPDFSAKTLDNDIAVVTISKTFEFKGKSGPACLPFQHSSDSFENNQVGLTPRGFLEFAKSKEAIILPQVRSRTREVKFCNELKEDINGLPTQICVVGNNKTACQLDNGGPVLWRDPKTNKTAVIGIIGDTPSCNQETPFKPFNAVRIGAYIDWIKSLAPKGYSYCKIE